MRCSLLLAVACSLGTSYAAGMGSKEDYASGAVHAQIMGLKMVTAIPRRDTINLLTQE